MGLGDYQRAHLLLEKGLALAQESGYWAVALYILGDLGILSEREKQYQQAEIFFSEQLELSKKHDEKWVGSYAYSNLASLAYDQGDFLRARTLVRQAIIIAWESGDRRLIFMMLELMGYVALRLGQPERAAKLLCTADVLAMNTGIPFQPEGSLMAEIRTQLNESTFESLQSEGRALSLNQAIALAMEETT